MRGLCIATVQYSTFCVCAVDLVLGGSDHMEDDDQDRRDEEIREGEETLGREEEIKHEEITDDQKRDDMWMRMFSQTRPQSP